MCFWLFSWLRNNSNDFLPNQEIGTECFLQTSRIAMSIFDGNRMLIVFESSGIALVRFLAMSNVPFFCVGETKRRLLFSVSLFSISHTTIYKSARN